MSRKDTFPVQGVSTHKCPRCKVTSKYTGLLFFSNLDNEKPIRESVRTCPCCGTPVIPLGE